MAFLRFNGDATSPDLFRMAADGRGSRRVAALPGGETHPTWSVDGRRFAFVSPDPSSTLGTLWVMNADGTGLHQLVADSLLQVAAASWSPDGTQLALNGLNPSFRQRIGVIAADGTSFQWVQGTENVLPGDPPSWSPDGRRLAYGAYGALGSPDGIRVVDADGANSAVLTTGYVIFEPSWSPDGTQLAFSSMDTRQDSLRIRVVNVDGTARKQVTSDRGDWRPAWSPDGRFVVYQHSVGPGVYHIYKSPIAGGSPVDLTPNDASAEFPMWRRVANGSN